MRQNPFKILYNPYFSQSISAAKKAGSLTLTLTVSLTLTLTLNPILKPDLLFLKHYSYIKRLYYRKR